ncbi:MAG: ATP-binding protein [Myxococcaceae bacterium]|nr:ATP-binding protein [Myxococcaceae bacterium]
MMTASQFLELLERSESDILDFKGRAYDLTQEYSRAALVKDVLCMSNTPREEPAHIILIGVSKNADGTFTLPGLDKPLDDADLQSQFRERVFPIPEFTYEVLKHEGKPFGIITIPPRRIGPSAVLKDHGDQLQQGLIYFRRNTQNDYARTDDLRKIISWFDTQAAPSPVLPSTVIEGSRPSSDPAFCRVAVLQESALPAASQILAVQAG